jgi:hypothetical protein
MGAPSSNGNTAAFSSGNPTLPVLELEPGVPVPAALLQPEGGSQPSPVAAAQQQITDDFLQEVDEALAQPETVNSDDAVNESYYDSLAYADERYRALYGQEAYNSETMRATLEAQIEN